MDSAKYVYDQCFLILQELPKLRINLGRGDGAATITKVDQEKPNSLRRKSQKMNINNNIRSKSKSKKKNARRSKIRLDSDESTEAEYSSDNESE